MPLSWNEIKSRAVSFSKDWKNATREEADAQEFLIEFLNVFGVTRRRVSTFEHKVKKLDSHSGYIDLFWPGMLLVEMKSKDEDLEKAYKQAKDYCHGLEEYQLPRIILICDFKNFHVYDTEGTKVVFTLQDFINKVRVFAPIAGYTKTVIKEQDPVNIDAARLMGQLHDQLKAIGYSGHELEVYLVRLLFLLFADDTNIFDKGIFNDYIEQRTKEDGSDLAMHLGSLFEVLNAPTEKRLKTLDEQLQAFPYVNGKLFEEHLHNAAFDREMRKTLLKCSSLDWGKISPAIFGSLFQSVMDEKARRNLGAHYTSEKNILKVIKPLFLDELWNELERAGGEKNKLQKLHDKISKLRFLDPACGCGNFLIIAYRELRLLELEIVKRLLKGQTVTNISHYFLVDVDQFYGIEYEEFPSQIAQVAMWLIDHQMNMLASEVFGEYYVRLPLKKSPHIIHDNALRIDWQDLIKPLSSDKHEVRFHYILGNPPFIGYAWQNEEQKRDLEILFRNVKGAGVLDYVTAWYIKAAQYLKTFQGNESLMPKTVVAFVSTNSITQGEQVGILWNELFNKYSVKIHFAHRTFKWSNEAKGNAGVHVVIIGFSNFEANTKQLFVYDDIKGDPHETKVSNINPYLVEGKDLFIQKRSEPLCKVLPINRGSDAIDDGNLLLSQEEKDDILKKSPAAEIYIKPFLMAKEFINSIPRYCIWLKGADLSKVRKISSIYDRIERVKAFREKSKRVQTLKAAKFPYLFGEERQPDSDYLAIPKVSSENRDYIPIGYCKKDIICGDKLFNMPNASLYHFGVLTSLMHMTWMRYTCGRLESRYSYSNTIVYNNFPWPENPSAKQVEVIKEASQKVLNVRSKFSSSSLADLYNPSTMPSDLVKAHQALDKAVDLCYRPQPFPNEVKRIEFLFDLYDKYTSGMFAKQKKRKQP